MPIFPSPKLGMMEMPGKDDILRLRMPCKDQNINVCVAEGCFAESCIRENKMRFWTIWTLPGLPLYERIHRTKDWLALETGLRLPLRLRYWTTMMMLGKATKTSSNVPATPLHEILRNLPAPKGMH